MGRKKSSPVKKAVTTTVVKKGDVPPPDDGDVAAAAGPPSSLGGLGRLPLVLAVLAVAAAALGPSLLSSYGGRSIPEAILEPVQEGRREAELDPVPADAASGDTAAPPKFGLAPAACDYDTLSQFLHDVPVRGMHLVCFGGDEAATSLRLFWGMHNTTLDYTIEDPAANPDREGVHGAAHRLPSYWESVRDSLEHNLQLEPPGPMKLPYALFTTRGERILGPSDVVGADGRDEAGDDVVAKLRQAGVVLIMGGGSWTWPGVRVGFKREIELYSVMPGEERAGPSEEDLAMTRKATVETLSLVPLVVSISNFIADDECDWIQEAAISSIQYSGVVLMDKDKGKKSSEWRTSQSTFLHATAQTEVLLDIERRTASLSRIPRSYQEDTKVLRYGMDEKYDAHHDFFNPELYQGSPSTLDLIQNGRVNRHCTVFWYLSDVEEGGETVFPRAGGAPQPHDFKDCTKGLLVKPEKGKVIIFYDLYPSGEMDEFSLHGGCPVKEGVKWAANKWVWNDSRSYVSNL